MPAGRYLFFPFLRAKNQMGQAKNWSSKKSHKNTNRTNKINIIDTNFVSEQLNRREFTARARNPT